MYLAKHKGRNNFKYYNAILNTEEFEKVISPENA